MGRPAAAVASIVLLAATLLTACSSSADDGPASASTSTGPSSSPLAATDPDQSTPSAAEQSTPSTAYPNNSLTGYGATTDAFAAHHDASTDTRLAAGCCYGPNVTVSDGESVSTWNLAANDGPLVINLTRNFPAGTDERTALALITQEDMPADLTKMKSEDQGTCKVFVYRSTTLAMAAPASALGAVVSIALYPPPDPAADPTYRSSSIEQAIETSGDGTEFGC